ncbi:hypothetical protein RQP46_000280 [Phenoliferia psychrophenolica]
MAIVSLIQGSTALSSYDLSASIIINGEKCPIYQIEDEGDCVTGFIEAVTGATYAVQVASSDPRDNVVDHIIDVFADGEHIGSLYCPRPEGIETETISFRHTGKSGIQHFMMEPLMVAAAGERAYAATDELGTISVEVSSCICVKTIPNGDFGPPKVIGSYRKFDESVTDFVSHETVFGHVKSDEGSPQCTCEQLQLIQTFRFIYLSKEILERRLSIEELEKLRQNNRALQLEQERLKEKVLKMQIKLLEAKLSKVKVQVVASSDSDSDGEAET